MEVVSESADALRENAAEGGVAWGQDARQQGNCTQKPRMWDVEHRFGCSGDPRELGVRAWASAKDWALPGRGSSSIQITPGISICEAWWTAVCSGLEWVAGRVRRQEEEMLWRWARSQVARETSPPTIFRSKQGACDMESKFTPGLAVQGVLRFGGRAGRS